MPREEIITLGNVPAANEVDRLAGVILRGTLSPQDIEQVTELIPRAQDPIKLILTASRSLPGKERVLPTEWTQTALKAILDRPQRDLNLLLSWHGFHSILEEA